MAKKKKKLLHKKKKGLIEKEEKMIKKKLSKSKKKYTAPSVYGSVILVAILGIVAGYVIAASTMGSSTYVMNPQKQNADTNNIGLPSDVPQATAGTGNHLYYIVSEGCSTCDSLKTVADEIAKKLDIGVTKIPYFKSMSIPGAVLIYNDILSINGINSKYAFEQSVCDITKNSDVCDMAAKDKPEDTTPPAPEVPKSDKPKVELFVMSYCPFGLQMEKALIPVMETLGDKADIKVKAVNYVMHGEKERDENTRQYCIQKESPDKFTDYFRCFAPAGDFENCMNEVGIDTAKIDACIEATNQKYHIMEYWNNATGRYPPYMVFDDLNKKYGVRGSPTMIINGQTVSVSRSQQAVLDAICNAFNNPPEECNTKLNTAQEQSGLGPIGTGTASASTTDAGCG